MSKVILCDVDGTLSNGNHRQHYLAVKPKNWLGFISQAPNDPPSPSSRQDSFNAIPCDYAARRRASVGRRST